MTIVKIGDRSRDGLLEIADTNWDSNGTLRVTVREMIGGSANDPSAGWVGGYPLAKMRRFARRAIMYPEKTRKSPEIRRFHANGQWYSTFAVSRNER